MGGAWNLNPGDEDWIDCHIDVCSGNDVNSYLELITTGHLWTGLKMIPQITNFWELRGELTPSTDLSKSRSS